LPEWVAGTAARHLKQPLSIEVDAGQDAATDIEHLVYDVHPSAKLGALRTLLDQRGDSPVLVFGRTKHGVKKLAERLGQLGYPAAALQGNLSQNQRQRVMHDFRSGAVPILLATNVAARGIDVAGIERVINYELPESAEWFTHRAGRTGRMGAKGEAVTFLTPEDEQKWRQIERALGHKLPRQRWPHEAPSGEVREPFVNFETAPREPASRPRLRLAPRPPQRQAYGASAPRRDDRAPVQADRYERRDRPAGPATAPRRPFGARPSGQGQPYRSARPA
jgi:superfamily II DNA/RNA helicase